VRWGIAFGMLAGAAGAGRAQSVGECLACHSNPDFATYSPQGAVISLFVDPKRYAGSVHAKNLCTDCHANFAAQLHGPEEGGEGTGGMMVPVEIPQKKLALIKNLVTKDRVAVLMCMDCHKKEAADYRASIHGREALGGNRDAPDCVTCHGSHYMLAVDDLESSVSTANVPATCARCHADATVMAKYDVATNTVISFEESFHGKKLKLGSERVAVCTSCHGVHNIQPPDDPRSTVYPANRPHTCGRCHEHADVWFGQDFMHKIPSRAVQPIAYWVGKVYVWIIYLTIGAMACFVMLDFARVMVDRRRGGGGE
jgi:hypothetical protein